MKTLSDINLSETSSMKHLLRESGFDFEYHTSKWREVIGYLESGNGATPESIVLKKSGDTFVVKYEISFAFDPLDGMAAVKDITFNSVTKNCGAAISASEMKPVKNFLIWFVKRYADILGFDFDCDFDEEIDEEIYEEIDEEICEE